MRCPDFTVLLPSVSVAEFTAFTSPSENNHFLFLHADIHTYTWMSRNIRIVDQFFIIAAAAAQRCVLYEKIIIYLLLFSSLIFFIVTYCLRDEKSKGIQKTLNKVQIREWTRMIKLHQWVASNSNRWYSWHFSHSL